MQRAKSGGRKAEPHDDDDDVSREASERAVGKWTGEKRLNLSSVSSVVAVAVDISGGGGRRQ